jgi:hypothetical protein
VLSRTSRWSIALLAAALLTGCTPDPARDSADRSRQAEVAERGRSVMPFDLDKTTHQFIPTDDGLVEEVTADRAGDTEQTALVRAHLAAEARRFSAGDYADPARIHGGQMPGLAQLSTGASRIEITYTDIPDGGRIRFRTSAPDLVDALHAWGAAQTTDHGQHATR